MKKFACFALFIIIAAALFFAGRAAGIRHSIESSTVWIVDDEPASTDPVILIDLDGQLYEYLGQYWTNYNA